MGYDGSQHAARALRMARDLAEEGSAVTVVTAYRVPPEVMSYEFFEDLRGAFKESAEEVLGSARDILTGGGPSTRFTTVEGSPAEVLAQVAREQAADLIVVGSRGLGGVRAALGSVTHKLLHATPCPVLVVPVGDESA